MFYAAFFAFGSRIFRSRRFPFPAGRGRPLLMLAPSLALVSSFMVERAQNCRQTPHLSLAKGSLGCCFGTGQVCKVSAQQSWQTYLIILYPLLHQDVICHVLSCAGARSDQPFMKVSVKCNYKTMF